MLDFSKRKRKTFNVTLHDGTKLKIPAPTMAIYTAMKDFAEDPENATEEDIIGMLRDILNSNKQGIAITDEQLEAFDLDDMKELFFAYAEFVKEVLSDPSSGSPIAR